MTKSPADFVEKTINWGWQDEKPRYNKWMNATSPEFKRRWISQGESNNYVREKLAEFHKKQEERQKQVNKILAKKRKSK